MGDFNFRIEGISQDKTLHYIEALKWPKLLKHDQLRRAAFVSGAFSTFKEGKIEFAPTYKFVGGTDTYDMRYSYCSFLRLHVSVFLLDYVPIWFVMWCRCILLANLSINFLLIFYRNPSKIRRPSYCDRILWRTRNSTSKVQLQEYTSHMQYRISDHKPVTAVFDISVRPKNFSLRKISTHNILGDHLRRVSARLKKGAVCDVRPYRPASSQLIQS